MSKPRIILADTDESYVAPLETKFINELSDRIDFEIITDAQYLNSLFSMPQQVDILMISEHLYSPLFLKHNISRTFIFVENQDSCRSIGDNITAIFKYSSIKEIYSHIMALSGSSMKIESITPNDTKIILLFSIPGGVGKTTLGLGISECIAQNYKKVLYVNADRINSFQFYLKEQNSLPINATANIRGVYSNSYDFLREYIRKENFDYLPPFHAALSTLDVDYAVYKEFVRKAKAMKNYDYIVVDADSVLDMDKSEMIAEADKVMIITNQTKQSIMATDLIGKNISCNDNEKFYYICNNFIAGNHDAAENNTGIAFQIDEYVNHIDGIENITLEELGQIFDIQKITFLVL